jgi:hypothetical protein
MPFLHGVCLAHGVGPQSTQIRRWGANVPSPSRSSSVYSWPHGQGREPMASVAFGTNRSRWEIVARFNATRPGIGEGIAAPIKVNANIVWLDTEQDLGD